MKSLCLSFLLLCAATLSFAGDNEFREVVHAIEGHYGVRQMHIPLLGVAVWFARPEGVSGMKLAVFENFSGPSTPEEVSRVIEDSLGSDWHPFIRVRSRNDVKGDAETTLIYASPSGGKLRMMIVNVEPSEATVVELKLSDHAITQWLKEPGEKAEDQSSHHRHHDDD